MLTSMLASMLMSMFASMLASMLRSMLASMLTSMLTSAHIHSYAARPIATVGAGVLHISYGILVMATQMPIDP